MFGVGAPSRHPKPLLHAFVKSDLRPMGPVPLGCWLELQGKGSTAVQKELLP